jgi:hypothetical protein
VLRGSRVTADAGHQLPPMKLPPHPTERQGNWIWVPVEQCTAASLVLAVLSDANGPIQVQKVVEEAGRLKGGEVSAGTVANVGTRLYKANAPVHCQGHLWGGLDVFEKQEVATHRRMAITHVLEQFPTGLQIVQIVQIMDENCPWFNHDIPCNKDLLKDDMEELAAQQKVKRQGNSGKWILA